MEIEPLGEMRTCFPEKFGIPRQGGLAPLARGVLRFAPSRPAAVWRDALRGIEGFTHLWVTFVFHEAAPEGWKALVRPPRLGGREKMGVFATRSPHRPNFLGLSLLELESVDLSGPSLLFKGVDLLDRTPIVDLRPYHPDHDLPQGGAAGGWIAHAPEPRAEVEWDPEAERQILSKSSETRGLPPYLPAERKELVRSLLALDPRPAHLRGGGGEWAMRLLDFDVKFRMEGARARVLRID